jgi:RNA recognition motif-containing protein
MNIFSHYGDVKSVKMKKPPSSHQNYNHQPCSAYVDFETHEQALAAQKALNGKQLLPGANFIRIEFYRKDNRFLGVHRGLDRNELIKNTHYRVLFIRGLDLSMTKPQLLKICE